MEHSQPRPHPRDTELARTVMVLSVLWILVVVASGVLLVAFRDLFIGIF